MGINGFLSVVSGPLICIGGSPGSIYLHQQPKSPGACPYHACP